MLQLINCHISLVVRIHYYGANGVHIVRWHIWLTMLRYCEKRQFMLSTSLYPDTMLIVIDGQSANTVPNSFLDTFTKIENSQVRIL